MPRLTDAQRGYAGWGPGPCSWLKPEVPNLNKCIVLRAHNDIGIAEDPESSNRGGFIDLYNKRAGAPTGSYWCASWATAMWEDCNAQLPAVGRGSCDVLFDWAVKLGLMQRTPVEGALILYGRLPHPDDAHAPVTWQGKKWTPRASDRTKPDAEHVGILMRRAPKLQSAEGNTSYNGQSRNGEAVQMKLADVPRILCYIHPIAEAA